MKNAACRRNNGQQFRRGRQSPRRSASSTRWELKTRLRSHPRTAPLREVMEYVTGARDRGIEVLIAAAGGSAGLARGRCLLDYPARHRCSPAQQRPQWRGRPLRHRADAARHSRRLRSSRLLGRAQRRIPRSADSRHQARQHPRRLRRLSPRPEKPLISSAFSQGERLGWKRAVKPCSLTGIPPILFNDVRRI